ncbi:T20D4.11-like domain-containing protein [Caenorhabditis elegans]|uniref:T20D4.11-like domain-containing protein n=1 Tax=Caenorhabditis elegans TaxID=6239 RepID=O18089_CAEEL|nr:DUF19 domain-containing protein [Caenorhabditis elegans]CAB07673.2 DUF19 domain-containing protein [Caenorhabditis elegans]|eukprot:NP_507107.2 Uncharacterized protein CELE_T13F3.6 [Caenorhabditis elegans]
MISFGFILVIGLPIFATAATMDDCKTIGLGLEPIIKSINVTDRFFWPPETYKAYADKCEEIINCVKSVDASLLDKFSTKVSPCLFYIFYNRDFSNCAKKLIAKKDDNISCLNTLFNDVHEPEVDECDQWDSLQPCIKENIANLCDDQSGKIQEQYVKQTANLRPEFCD